MRKKKWNINDILLYLLLLLFAAILCSPVYLLISGSFMAQDELSIYLRPAITEGDTYVRFSLLPVLFTLRGYVELLLDTPEFFHMFWNSIKLVTLILLGQLCIAVPAAWGFARMKLKGKDMLFFLYIILMLMPFQVTMLSNYLTLNKLGMLDTHQAIIWPAVFSTFPVFLLHRFFADIPNSILEAARIDGAGRMHLFIKIGCPLASPGIMAAMVLGYLEYWNLVEQPLIFLKDKTLWPLTLYLPQIGLENAQIAFVSSVIVLLPSALVFFAGQDHLEQGIAASAVKE